MIFSYDSFISERKQSSLLYHYTSLAGIFNILTDDILLANSESVVSLTRNKYFHSVKRIIGSLECRLIIDGESLSDKYKLSPFNYFKHSMKSNLSNNESEERINGDILGIKRYTVGINLYSGTIRNIAVSMQCNKNRDLKFHMGDFCDNREETYYGYADIVTLEMLKEFMVEKFGIPVNLA